VYSPISQLWSINCHMRSHSATCHLTRVNALYLYPGQAGWYFIYFYMEIVYLSTVTQPITYHLKAT